MGRFFTTRRVLKGLHLELILKRASEQAQSVGSPS
jgi:hypothetical protein